VKNSRKDVDFLRLSEKKYRKSEEFSKKL